MEVGTGKNLGWPLFSQNAQFLYYLEQNDGLAPGFPSGVVSKIDLNTHRIERFPVKFSGTGHWAMSLSLGPDDVPFLMRDARSYDIYALELEWK
jgi:hypothetical protein